MGSRSAWTISPPSFRVGSSSGWQSRAIAKRPNVLLCDEPTGALDSKTGIRVIEALLKVNEQFGTTTLIITHNASIQDVADRVLFFGDGQITRERRNERRRQAAELSW